MNHFKRILNAKLNEHIEKLKDNQQISINSEVQWKLRSLKSTIYSIDKENVYIEPKMTIKMKDLCLSDKIHLLHILERKNYMLVES